jgi:membrane-associated phospholipid phosphatase
MEVDTDLLQRGGAFVAGAILVERASSATIGRKLDRRVFELVNAERAPGIDGFFAALTELGSITASIAAAGLLAASGRRRTAALALGSAAVTWFAGQGLKRLYLRARPYDTFMVRLLIGKPRGTSWPSSHPAVLYSFLTVAGRELDLSRSARVALAALAGLVATSRVSLGVHYPSDVVAGMMLGHGIGLCGLAIGTNGSHAGP